MKSFKNLITLLSVIPLLGACHTDTEVPMTEPEHQNVLFTGSDFLYEASPRTVFNITESGAEFTWAERDTVGIFPDKGDQISFSMQAGAGSQTASFSGGGWGLKKSHTYYAYFPFSRKNFYDINAKEHIKVSYEGQMQTGNSNPAGIGNYDFMVAAGTSPASGALNFQFAHLGALLQISVTVPEAMDVCSLSLNTDEEMFLTEGSYNLTDASPGLVPSAMSRSMNLALQAVTLSSDNLIFVAYLMIPPTDLSGKKLTVKVENSEGEVYSGTVDGKNCVAGKAYQFQVTVENTSINTTVTSPEFEDEEIN